MTPEQRERLEFVSGDADLVVLQPFDRAAIRAALERIGELEALLLRILLEHDADVKTEGHEDCIYADDIVEARALLAKGKTK